MKKLTVKYNALNIIVRQNLIGAIYFLPIFLIFEFKTFINIQPTRELVLAVLQLAVFGSCIAFIFFTMAIAKLGMVKANIFTNLIPVFTAVFSYFVLYEVFNVQKITGIVLVLLGIVVSQMREIRQLILRKRGKLEKERM